MKKREKRNVPEFTPPKPNCIERVRKKNKEISEKELKALKYLSKNFFQNIFSDYVYEINFPKNGRLVQINKLALATKSNSKFRSHIYRITFPPTLKNIESFAFKGCTFLNEITFLKDDNNSNALENINNNAFSSTILQSISIPSKIKAIGSNCFPSTIQKIEFEKGAPRLQKVDSGAFSNLQIESFIMPVNITPFLENKNIFIGCRKLKNISFDKYILKEKDNSEKKSNNDEDDKYKLITRQKESFKEKIQKWAKKPKNKDNNEEEEEEELGYEPTHDLANSFLLSQTNVEKIDVSVTDLSKFYFYNMPNLKKISIKNDKKYIKNKGCVYTNDMERLIIAERNIKEAIINANCKIISNYALNIPTLKKVTFEDDSKLQEISFLAFSESSIKTLILPNTVDRIDYAAFFKCSKLESINIPSLIDTIDYLTFAHCKLAEIVIPKNVCRIEYGSFYCCKNLKKVIFEKDSQLKTIGDYAFACTKIKSFLVPKSVQKISRLAFLYCDNLQIWYENDFNAMKNQIEKDDFNVLKYRKITENECLYSFYKDYVIEEGCIYSNDMKQLIDAERNIKEAKINQQCQILGNNSLSIKSLRKVTFDKKSKLETIKKYAFSESQIKTIKLPKTVKSIGEGSFYKCSKLESFVFPPLVTELEIAVLSRTNITEITIPKSVTKINHYCFYHSHNLSKVKFEKGSKLEEIGDYAFAYTKIRSIIFPESVKRIVNCFIKCGELKAVYKLFSKYVREIFPICKDRFSGTKAKFYLFMTDVEKFDLFENIDDKDLDDLGIIRKYQHNEIPTTEDFNDIYANFDDLYTNENGVIYSKNMKLLFDVDRSHNEIKINSKCQVILPYSLNKENLKIVSFEEDSDLQKIEEYAFNKAQIKSLVLPNSVKTIKSCAFYECSKLESINIPPNIEILEHSTFSFTKLTEITIPKSVTIIRQACFYRCYNLGKVTFEKNSKLKRIKTFAFAFTKIKTFSLPKSVESIGDYCFIDCKNLKSFDIHVDSKLKKIGVGCFQGTQITSFKLPQDIKFYDFSSTAVEKIAFSEKSTFSILQNCMKTQLQQISIPPSVQEINSHAFFECFNLKEVIILDKENSKLNKIHTSAFNNCISLEKFEIPKTVKLFGHFAFKNCEKYNANIKVGNDKLLYIYINAFENSGIVSFEAESKDIIIENNAFVDCKNLTQFTTKVSRKCQIGKNVFQNCSALTNANISPDVSKIKIDEECFINSAIQSFEVPHNLIKIPKSCFKKCTNLAELKIKDDSKITSFEQEAFAESGIKSISIPSNLTIIKENCFLKCTKLKKVTFSKKLKSCELGIKAFAFSGVSKISIPQSIKKINRRCFKGCKNLKEVTFSDSLKFNIIEGKVFQDSGLEALTIPSSISFIDKSAFRNCKQLKSVDFQSERINISLNAFTGCKSLNEVKSKSTIVIEPITRFLEPNFLIILNHKQIEKAMIDAFFVDSEPFYHLFCQFDFKYTLLIDKKYHFTQTFDWTFPKYRLRKYYMNPTIKQLFDTQLFIEDQKITHRLNKKEPLFVFIECFEGGYYKNFRKNLIHCDFDLENIIISKDAETIEINALKHSKIKKVEFEANSKLREIKESAFEGLEIEEITIPDSVVTIGKSAFRGCRSLKIVNINPSSQLESIEESAFEGASVVKFFFPPSLSNIGKFAFYKCLSLKTVDNQSNNIKFGYGSFSYSSIKTIKFPKNSIFCDSAFKHCTKLNQLSFLEEPDTIDFGEESFAFTNIDKIKLKNAVNIQSNAFIFCKSMKSINLTKSANFCNNSFSFSGFNVLICSIALKTMLKNQGININDYFCDLSSSSIEKLSLSLTLPDKSKRSLFLNHKCLVEDEILIYADLIDNASLYEKPSSKEKDNEIKKNEILRIPSNAKKLNFPVMSHIKKINWGSSSVIEDLGPEGFFSYYSLVEITIPNTVTTLSPHLFEHCHYLRTLQFDENSKLTEIPAFCFAHTRIKKAILPSSVKIIGESAFFENQELNEISFEGEIIKSNAFNDTGITEFKLSNNTTTIESNAFRYCHSLTKFDIDIDKSKLSEVGSYAFSDTSIEEINIPPKITRIRKGLFNGCYKLTKVNISNKSKLKRIDRYSFCSNTSLKTINLPKSISIISPKSFINTPQLESIMNESNKQYEIEEDQSIYHKDTLIFVPRTIQEYKLKSTCKIIQSSAFCGSNLENIIFPEKSFKIIERESFSHCTNLKTITIPKSVEQLGEGLFNGCENLETISFEEGSLITEIPKFCFSFSGLKSIEFPNSIKKIEHTCFNFCYNLQSITIFGYHIDGNCNHFAYIDKLLPPPPNPKKNDKNDEDILAEEGIFDKNKHEYYIHNDTLYYISIFDNYNLYKKPAKKAAKETIKTNEILYIPFFVKKLDFPVFSHIKRINWGINSNIEDLGPSGFFSYSNLIDITIPSGVKTLSPKLFEHCHYLRILRFERNSKLTEISPFCFANTKIEKVQLPKSVKIIGESAFCNNLNLKKVIFEGEIIKSNAFSDTGITEFKLSNNTTTIESNAFRYCHSLTKFEIDVNKSKLSEVGSYAFSDTSIEEINIPPKITRIRKGVFNGCYKLTKVNISNKSKLKRIDRYSFCCNTSLKTINLPKSISIISPKSFINTPQLESIMNESNKQYDIEEDQSIYHKDTLIFVPRTIQEYKLKSTCKIIQSSAFCGAILENIIFPENSLQIIKRESFSHCTNLKTITIPKSVEQLGEGLFNGCENLETISFEEGSLITEIPKFCFSFSGLKSIEFPNSIKKIEHTCFNFCYNLQSITIFGYHIDGNCNHFAYIDKLLSKNNKNNKDKPTEDEPSKIVETEDNDESKEQEESEITIVDKNKHEYHIHNDTIYCIDMFHNYTLYEKPDKKAAKETIKPNEILRIPFFVKKLNFPPLLHIKKINWGINCNIEDIGPEGFFSYYSLVEITIPNTVKTLSPHLFEHCHHLRTLKFAKNSKITEIPAFCFAHTRIKKAILPSSVKIIGESAFFENQELNEVSFEGEIIKSNAFNDTGITEFKLSNNTTTIESNAFRYCHSLTKFDIDVNKSKLSEVGSYAFSDTSIEEINIPPKITRIRKGLFNGCYKLTKVNISNKSKLKRIDRYSFCCNTSLKTINLPKSISIISPKSFINTPQLESIMNESNKKYEIEEDQSIYHKDTLIFVPRTIQEYKLKSTCKTIQSGAFCGAILENIIFPEKSLRIIERESFSHCTNLKIITIPKSVRQLGEGVFSGCENLETVEFEEGSTLKEIPKFCFSFSGLKSIKFPKTLRSINHSSFYFCQNLKDVNLNETLVEYIGEYAFSATAIEKVAFPSTIRLISSHAFDDIKTLEMIDLSKVSKIESALFIKNIRDNKKDQEQGNEQQQQEQEEDIQKSQSVDQINIQPPSSSINESSHFIRHSRTTVDDGNPTPNNIVHPPHQASSRKSRSPTIIKPNLNQKNKVQLISKNNRIYNSRLPKLPDLPSSNQNNNDNNNENNDSARNPNSGRNDQSSKIRHYQPNPFIANVEKGTCLVCETAFCNSAATKIKLKTAFCWFDFFDKMKLIHEIRFNENVQCIIEKPSKLENNNNNYSFAGLYYKVKKLKWQDFSYLPLLSNQLITSFSISEKVEKLESFNFSDCINLKRLTFEGTSIIKSIPKCCFTNTLLEEVSIPDSVEIIEESAFLSCNNLKKVIFSPESKLSIIKDCAFSRCEKLTSINIPNKIEIISKNCFSSTGLTSIEIPASVKKIDSLAFCNCKKLKKVVLNQNIVEIGDHSFANDVSLKSIDLPDSLETIKSFAFWNCKSLKRVNTTDDTKLVKIYDGAFDNTLIEKLKINQSAKKLFKPTKVPNLNQIIFSKGKPKYFIQKEDGSIYEKTDEFDKYIESKPDFSYKENVMKRNYQFKFVNETYYYSDSFNKYTERDFKNDNYYTSALSILVGKIHEKEKPILRLIFVPKNLETLKIAENCLSLSDSILNDMKNLTAIEYEKGISNIISYYPNYFNHFYSGVSNQISSLKILSRFAYIENSAFSHFESLQTVDFGNSKIPIISKNAFLGCKKLQNIIIPSYCFTIEEGAFKDCESLESVAFKSNRNLKYIRKEAFYNCSSLKSIEIPSSVSVICEGAFMNCEKLEKASFRQCKDFESLEIIEKYAFKNCTSLASFVLPNSCIYLGPATFMNCTSLQSFDYKGDKLMCIQSRTFFNCSSLQKIEMKNIYYNNNESEETTKKFIFTINSEAFMNCTSLNKAIFEDGSKEIETIKFDKEEKNALFTYPVYKKLSHLSKENKYFINRRQIIHKNAFANCTSLKGIRLFLGNLESIQENAFKNCKALKLIEINSKYFKYMLTDRLYLSAFEGTPEKMKVKVFNKGTEVKDNPYLLVNKIEKYVHDPSKFTKRLFKDHLSTLNKNFFDLQSSEKEDDKEVKRIRPKSTVIDLFDGPKCAMHFRPREHYGFITPGPGSYDICYPDKVHGCSMHMIHEKQSCMYVNINNVTNHYYNISSFPSTPKIKIHGISNEEAFGSLFFKKAIDKPIPGPGQYSINRFPILKDYCSLHGHRYEKPLDYVPGPGSYEIKRYPLDKRQSNITITSVIPQKSKTTKNNKKGKDKKLVVSKPPPNPYRIYDISLNKELFKWIEFGQTGKAIPVPFECCPKVHKYSKIMIKKYLMKFDKSFMKHHYLADELAIAEKEKEKEGNKEPIFAFKDDLTPSKFYLIVYKNDPSKSISKKPIRTYVNRLSHFDCSFFAFEIKDEDKKSTETKEKTKNYDKNKSKKQNEEKESKTDSSKKTKKPTKVIRKPFYPASIKVKNPLSKKPKRFFKKHVSHLNKSLIKWFDNDEPNETKLELTNPFDLYTQKMDHMKLFKEHLSKINVYFINNQYPVDIEKEKKRLMKTIKESI